MRCRKSPCVIGHSMGGLIALLLCARGLARAGVLLTPAAPPSVIALRPSNLLAFARIQMQLGLVAQAASRDARPRRCRTPSTPPIRGEGTRTACGLRARFGPRPVRDGPALARRQQGDDGRSRLRRRCRCCSWPPRRTGSRRPDVVRRAARRFAPCRRLVEYPGQGHWVLGQPGWERVADGYRRLARRQGGLRDGRSSTSPN